MLTDSLEVNERLKPEVVILDEAQRIKNWNTKTALAVKRLRSRYAWVLTGTPLENRIDELYSLVSFLDPSIFGPLFRFNREFYDFDERGRPRGYRNLERLRERIRPILLRRRKTDVETELPNRVERTFLVPLSESQRTAYQAHEAVVTRLIAANRRRPLTEPQRERLMRELNMLRMICDSPYILNASDRACPKLDELSRLLAECMANPEVKVLVFSEWERMLELVGDLCRKLRIDFATHSGSLTTAQRRQEIGRFREEAKCRVLLSTDTGGIGLNLQHASVVINCDQPWNPARLEQRVARAWRKDQTHAVTVLNLVSERTHRAADARHPGQQTGAQRGRPRPARRPRRDQTGRRTRELHAAARNACCPRRKRPLPTRAAARGRRQKPARGPCRSRPSARRPPAGPGRTRRRTVRASFARMRLEMMNGFGLVSCEERFPTHGEASVLLLVVETDAEQWREKLRPLEREHFTETRGGEPPPAVRLEVVDRATAELLRRLAEAGVVSPSLRASRVLYPFADGGDHAPLSPQEQHRARQARDQHARKLKMARVLAAEEMVEEARAAVTASIFELGRALAIEHRVPEPANARGAVAPPLDAFWPGGEGLLGNLRGFLADEHAAVHPTIALLGSPNETGARQARDFFAGIKAKLATIGG